MFIWPDGQVTGAEHWSDLALLIGEKPDESTYYANGRPSKAGWERLEAHLKAHVEATTPAAPGEPEEAVADDAEDEGAEPPKAPRRGRPPKES